LLCGVLSINVLAAEPAAGRIQFNRDIRPVLAATCFPCHGPDAALRKADLRLDDEASVKAERDGYRIVMPGKPGDSELVRRIVSRDDTERMPPPNSDRQLTPAEIDLLRRWVEQGAAWEQHWSFIPPQRPAVPQFRNLKSEIRNPIDSIVLARLDHERLSPSPEADRPSLIRRVSLDLTGLPPTPAEVDAFIADESPDAYEKIVDRLLASPRYGERLALDWLDAARFADSGGYQGDIFRTMWPWRDWVIAAFNRNLPFDQFTIEQLAGDLLPSPSRDQLVASGFNRNHRINDEDGIILEEFRVEYVVDRVETTATVWLGLTMGCGRCHDHKYDPISQRDYYRFFAFFNSLAEQGRGHGNAPPILRLTTPEQDQQAAEIAREIESLQGKLKALESDPAAAAQRDELTKAVQAATKKRDAVLAAAPMTMIQQELESPRDTFILTRGAYDKPGEKVTPGVPAILPPLPDGMPANRLAFARWLVDPANPLTARVIVNRYWQMLFGTGLVATPEDFGTQGELPTHPELLDWLATEFVRTGWDVKSLLKLIVTSATYRQSSHSSGETIRGDPDNRLLARGARFRLPAELLRDQALAVSGLLVEKLGGPSVRPYQPDGLWRELMSNELEYNQSHGPDLYRRGLYTFWRRTVPPPAMQAFDAPPREICTARRPRTNTPIQALAMMNDPTFVETSRVLAARVLKESGPDPDARIAHAFRLVTARKPSPAEHRVLLATWQHFRDRFAANPEAAVKLIAVGESPTPTDITAADLAAWAALATTILNLDEAVTKE
jgi:hypothetical protein